MATQLRELMISRESTEGESAAATLVYDVIGTSNDIAVKQDVDAGAPDTYDGLTKQSVHVEPIFVDTLAGYGRYLATVRYGLLPPPKEAGEASFSFDTTGGQQKITQSLQTIGAYAPAGKTAPDFKGAIGVTHEAVEGVEITVPVFGFTLTLYLAAASVTSAYLEDIKSLTGKVNNAIWNVYVDGVTITAQAGECLFLGASGSKRGADDWEISFKFALSRNVSGLSVGDISGINKKGWEYLWVRYDDADDAAASALVKRPMAAYVEKVYELGDFTKIAGYVV